jgi:2-haloacid dehalogenase
MQSGAWAALQSSETTALTFDCYGTLVDWETGACTALRQIYGYPAHVTDARLVELFLEADARMLREGVFPYVRALERVARSIARTLRSKTSPRLEAAFANSVGRWPVFEETNPSLSVLSQRYRLAIISNIDDHLLAQTIRQIDVSFDVLVTSERVKSYGSRDICECSRTYRQTCKRNHSCSRGIMRSGSCPRAR